MDFFKVHERDLSPELSDSEVGALVRYMSLTSRLNRFPTRKEIAKETSIRAFAGAEQSLSRVGATAEQVASRVLADVKIVTNRREKDKLKKQLARDKEKELLRLELENVPRDVTGDVTRDVTGDVTGDVLGTYKSKSKNKKEEKEKEKAAAASVSNSAAAFLDKKINSIEKYSKMSIRELMDELLRFKNVKSPIQNPTGFLRGLKADYDKNPEHERKDIIRQLVNYSRFEQEGEYKAQLEAKLFSDMNRKIEKQREETLRIIEAKEQESKQK